MPQGLISRPYKEVNHTSFGKPLQPSKAWDQKPKANEFSLESIKKLDMLKLVKDHIFMVKYELFINNLSHGS